MADGSGLGGIWIWDMRSTLALACSFWVVVGGTGLVAGMSCSISMLFIARPCWMIWSIMGPIDGITSGSSLTASLTGGFAYGAGADAFILPRIAAMTSGGPFPEG
ncbi:unnamed protein product [Mortierella alpina]